MGTPGTPVDTLCELFGSQQSLAAAIAVNPAVITRWRKPLTWRDGKPGAIHRGRGGKIPPEYNVRILGAALASGVDFEAVNECLDKTCPKCGQPLPMEG